MDWAETHVFSTLYICWAAQAGMYYRYGVPKYELPRKCSGVFRHRLLYKNFPLLRGFDDYFFAPHSATPRCAPRTSPRCPSCNCSATA